jgi:hypothetical protein
MLLPKIILTFEQDKCSWFYKTREPSNPLTQFNYSSLQLRIQPNTSSFGISGGKSFDVGSEGKLSFLQLFV